MLFRSPDAHTRLTRLFSGRPARSMRNRLTDQFATHETNAALFPAQRSLIAPLAKAALAEGKTDFHNLWSGQAGQKAEALATSQIIEKLLENTRRNLN